MKKKMQIFEIQMHHRIKTGRLAGVISKITIFPIANVVQTNDAIKLNEREK